MTDDRLLFGYLRRKLGALTQAEVDEFNAVLREWKAANGVQAAPDAPTASKPPETVPKALRDPAGFYGALKGSFGALTQSQVDGFNRLLGAMGQAGWPVSWVAYGLATAWWETNKQMHPVEEGYYLGPERAKRHQRTLRYYPWYGRGDVQLTWEKNYRDADAALGLGGRLVANPDLALDPEISARILVWGMSRGKFTGKGLGDYLPNGARGDPASFGQARRIINGQDKAAEIAAVAMKMQAALNAGVWA